MRYKIRFFKRLLVSALVLGSAAHPVSALVRMAVIAGNNEGLPEDPILRFAASDAENVKLALEELGGVDREQGRLLLNASAKEFLLTLQETRRKIAAHKARGEKVQLLLYFSGHGSQDALHMNGEKLQLDRIRAIFKDMGADLKLLIADACFSGSLLQGKGASLAPPVPVRYHDDLKVNGSAILTSSSAGELAQESKELRGSVFTHFFLSAIRGAGDADHDGTVTLWEAYHHTLGSMRRKLAVMTGVAQTPEFEVDLQGSESVVLTRLSLGEASLILKNVPLGRYQVFEAVQARPVAEVTITGAEGAVLSLPKGQYLIYRGAEYAGDAGERMGASGFADLRKRSLASLSEPDFEAVAPGSLFSKGNLKVGEPVARPASGINLGGGWHAGTWGLATVGLAYVNFPGWSAPAFGGELAAQMTHGKAALKCGILALADELVGGGKTLQHTTTVYMPEDTGRSYSTTVFRQSNAWGVSAEAAYLLVLGRHMLFRPGLRVEYWRFDQAGESLGKLAEGRTLGTLAVIGWEAFLLRHLSVTLSVHPGVFWFATGSGAIEPSFTAPFAFGVNLPW